LIAKNQLDAHLSIVVTDLDFHAMWLSRMFHRYFVAIEETKVHLEMLGLPSERITVSGIPIDPEFAYPIDRTATRHDFGLHPTRPTLLLSAGALGVGPAEFVVERLRNLRNKTQTLVVCGHSAETKERVVRVVGRDAESFKVFGYTDRMPDLMKISDLCNEMTTIPYKIDTLLDDPDRLEQMRKRAFALSRPDAARCIAETLVGDEMPALEVTDDDAEAIILAAAREKDNKLR
jgi:processive 1,2-diacylglycerol beta-glucosyltransferase